MFPLASWNLHPGGWPLTPDSVQSRWRCHNESDGALAYKKLPTGMKDWSGGGVVPVIWTKEHQCVEEETAHWIVTLGKSFYFPQASVYSYVEREREYLPIKIWAFWGPRVGNREGGGNPAGLCPLSLHLSPLAPLFYKKSTLQLGGEFIAPQFWP